MTDKDENTVPDIADDFVDLPEPTEDAVEAPVEVEAVAEVEAAPEAPEEPEAEPEKVEPAVETPAEHMVPVSAMVSERVKRQALEHELAQLQKPAPAPMPDIIEDPDGFSSALDAKLEARIVDVKKGISMTAAVGQYGQERVDAAIAYFDANPAQSQALLNDPSPYHSAVQIAERAAKIAAIGDPDAYRAQVRAEVEAELLGKNQSTEAVRQLAPGPSLANETSIGTRQMPAADDFTPLEDLL